MPASKRPRVVRGTSSRLHLLIGTRKGAFFLQAAPGRRAWKLAGPHYLGNIVSHVVLDPRDRRTLLVATRTGHLGPTVFRSLDFGKTWQEARRPPAFLKAETPEAKREVDHVFWLTPGHASEPGVWYAGTSPQGLFRSEDGGVTWDGVAGFNDNSMRGKWTGGAGDATPDGPKMHSILIDPRDARHIYIGMSSGGVFETRDRCRNWQPLNQGCRADFLPDPNPEYGHDPHCVRLHPLMPDRLFQQNHCGIYRMERAEGRWVRIGESMPKKIGDIGFPLVLHPRDPDTLWVFWMDGTTVWPRVSPEGKPAAYVSRNAGRSWQRLDRGLPRGQAWWTVKRQAMCTDTLEPVGIYFGTTSGKVWGSVNEGRRFACLARHLPEIYSVEAAEA